MLHGTRPGDNYVARRFACCFKALAQMNVVQTLPLARRRFIRAKSPGRSKITNGSLLPSIVDGRSTWARRCRDLISLHLSDLGGEDAVSEAERSLVRRVSVLTVQLEQLEQRFALANGDASAKDLDLYQRTAGNLRRLLQTLGLHRRSKDVTPDPLQFARSYQNDDGE
jgi:hypothetical protein